MTSHDQRLRRRAEAPAGRAGGLDRRDASTRVPKNIYGVTKTAAEDLCRLFWRNERLPCVVLRTSRFFPEADDDPEARTAFADDNLKANEFLYRRVAIEDVVEAHLLAAERAPAIGFGKYIVSATTPFRREDAARLRADAAGGRARARAGLGGRIRAPRLAHGRLDRPRLRQRARAARARLAAEVGLRGGRRAPAARPATFAGRWRRSSARRGITPRGAIQRGTPSPGAARCGHERVSTESSRGATGRRKTPPTG